MSNEENKDFAVPEGLAQTKAELIEKLQRIKTLDDIREDKPKGHNFCRDCVGFRTHFCCFWDTDPARAAPLGSDYACCDFWAKPSRKARRLTYDHFLRNVENL